jgi:tetratricopeptide (TPR) repeat protein
VDDPDTIAKALQNLGIVAYCQSEWQEARKYYQQSLTLFRDRDDMWGMAIALGNLVEVCQQLEEYREATVFLEESLALRQEMGERLGIADALRSLGCVARATGDIDLAKRHLTKALWIAVEVTSVPLVLEVLLECAVLWRDQCQEARALETLAFVLGHPDCETRVRDKAQELWNQWVADKQDRVVHTTRQRAQRMHFDEVVAAARGQERSSPPTAITQP